MPVPVAVGAMVGRSISVLPALARMQRCRAWLPTSTAVMFTSQAGSAGADGTDVPWERGLGAVLGRTAVDQTPLSRRFHFASEMTAPTAA